MQHVLIIETQAPGAAQARLPGLALALEAAQAGLPVSLWLMQDATEALRLRDDAGLGACCTHPGIAVFADDFALAQRGIALDRWPDVTAAPMADLAARLLDRAVKPIWH
jgi:hypothetical protein